MKVVVDTNVLAYFLLGTESFHGECDRFWREVEEPSAPALWEVELANVLWMAVRKHVIDLPEALRRFDLAKALGLRSVAVTTLWHGDSSSARRSKFCSFPSMANLLTLARTSADSKSMRNVTFVLRP